jgi:hypothetical protein
MQATLDRMPILVKAGAIIPMQALMDYSDQRPMDTLTVHVYPESDSATSFTMYEDDGKTLNYQTGAYAQTLFSQQVMSSHDTGGTAQSIQFTIGASQGTFTGQLAHRTYLVDFHGLSSPPASVQLNGHTLTPEASMSSLTIAGTGFYYDTLPRQLYVQFASATDTQNTLIVNNTQLVTDVKKYSTPTQFALDQNYPNPFNPSTTISFTLKDRGYVTLEIFNILGKRVATLVSDTLSPGAHSVVWKATGHASGTYFYRLEAGAVSVVKKLVLLK